MANINFKSIKGKSVLLIAREDITRSPRPRRALKLFIDSGCNVDLIGYSLKEKTKAKLIYNLDQNVNIYSKFCKLISFILLVIYQKIKLNKKKELFWLKRHGLNQISDIKIELNYDFIMIFDIYFLPLIANIKRTYNFISIFDIRECYPLQRESSLIFRLSEKIIREYVLSLYLKEINIPITVSHGLKKYYSDNYNVDCDVIFSVPYKAVVKKSYQDEKIRIVHHGVANKSRRIENMIDIVNTLPDKFTLDLYLNGDKKYISFLKSYVNSSKINFNEPVETTKIIDEISQFDLAIIYYEPLSFNLLHCMPNKFFEYIQAKVPVVIGPSPDMLQIIRKYKTGFSSNEFSIQSIVDTINSISPDDLRIARDNCASASTLLSWDSESIKLKKLLINDS